MKNILFINNSDDGSDTVYIEDLNKLNVNVPEQKDAKDTIEFTLKSTGDGIGHSKKFGDFEVIHGEIIDMEGYKLLNILYEVFGNTFEKPLLVEKKVFCYSNI